MPFSYSFHISSSPWIFWMTQWETGNFPQIFLGPKCRFFFLQKSDEKLKNIFIFKNRSILEYFGEIINIFSKKKSIWGYFRDKLKKKNNAVSLFIPHLQSTSNILDGTVGSKQEILHRYSWHGPKCRLFFLS